MTKAKGDISNGFLCCSIYQFIQTLKTFQTKKNFILWKILDGNNYMNLNTQLLVFTTATELLCMKIMFWSKGV